MKTLAIIGTGGHAKSILDIVDRMGHHSVVGFVSDTDTQLYPIIGKTSNLRNIVKSGVADEWIVAVGSNYDRELLVDMMPEDTPFATIIHPSASIASSASIGQGVVIMAGAVVNAGAIVEPFAIVNTGGIVEHDCIVSNFASIAPNAVMGGNSVLGRSSHIGIGAVMSNKVLVGDNTVIGAGAVVVKDIESGVVAVGVPARAVKARNKWDSYM